MTSPEEVIGWLERIRDSATRMELASRTGLKLAAAKEAAQAPEKSTTAAYLWAGSEPVRWYRLAMEADALAAVIARDGSSAFIQLDIRIAPGSEDAARAEGVELKDAPPGEGT